MRSTRDAWAGLRRHEQWLWTAAILAVVVIQWPVLKGYYYKAASTTPPPSAVEWRTDFEAALIEARDTRKQVLVDFTADWCPPCIAMKHDVWPDTAVGRAVADGYIPVMVNIDRDPAGISDRYRVRGIPTILVLDDSGSVLRQASFFTAARLIRFLSEREQGD